VHIHGVQDLLAHAGPITHPDPRPRIESQPHHVGQQLGPIVEELVANDYFPMKQLLEYPDVTTTLMQMLTLQDAVNLAASFRAAKVVVNDQYRVRTRYEMRKTEDAQPKRVSLYLGTLQRLGRDVKFTCAGCNKRNLRLKSILSQYEMVKFIYHCNDDAKRKLRFLCVACHDDWTQFCSVANHLLYQRRNVQDIPLLSLDISQRQAAVSVLVEKLDTQTVYRGKVSKDKAKTIVQSYPDTFHPKETS